MGYTNTTGPVGGGGGGGGEEEGGMGKHNPETGVGRRGEDGNEIWGADDEEEEERGRENVGEA